MAVDPRLVISGPRSVEGFWLGHWMRQRSIPSLLLLFREIASLNRQGILHSEIGQIFPLRRHPGRRPRGRHNRPTGKNPRATELTQTLYPVLVIAPVYHASGRHDRSPQPRRLASVRPGFFQNLFAVLL